MGALTAGWQGVKRAAGMNKPCARHSGLLPLASCRTAFSQVLTCTEEMMRLRVDFLLRQGLSQEEVGRAVLAHPQVGWPGCGGMVPPAAPHALQAKHKERAAGSCFVLFLLAAAV